MSKFKNYIKNSFSEITYNSFENDIYWGIPSKMVVKENFLNILTLQQKIRRFNIVKNLTHNSLLEVGWTILPVLILIVIALPSMKLLYFMENPLKYTLFTYDCTVTVIGHQWYWAYEYITLDNFDIIQDYLYKDFYNMENNNTKLFLETQIKFNTFDSYMLSLEDTIAATGLRLLDVDKPLLLPVNTKLNFLITSIDVIHSWAIPSLGIKTDAIPGRISTVSTIIKDTGIYYGQCSEICGVGHGFMPIKLISV